MHVAILGNGIAGATAARTVRKERPDWRITMISSESDLPYSRPALMYLPMGHMRFEDTLPWPADFFAKNRIELLRGHVTALDVDEGRLGLDGGGELRWDRLLLAVGSEANRFGWPGQELGRVQAFTSLQDVDRLEEALRAGVDRAVVVGGGLIGIELAEVLAVRGVPVTMLVREESYWDNVLPRDESALVSDLVRRHGVDLRLGAELRSIDGDERGDACAVVTSTGDRIACRFVGLTAGVRPNVALAREAGLDVARGILVDRSLRTSSERIWAAGDCAEIRDGAASFVEQVWYTARAQGEVAGRSVAGLEASYARGVWFNSAKFFDLEWQVYGDVPNGPRDGLATRYWQHPSGRHALRLVFESGSTALRGLSAMGLRYRHRVCEAWIAGRLPVRDAVGRLEEAMFDPELSARFGGEIRAAWRDLA